MKATALVVAIAGLVLAAAAWAMWSAGAVMEVTPVVDDASPAADPQSAATQEASAADARATEPARESGRESVEPARAPAEAGEVTLRGRCVDGDTGAPLAGCEITLQRAHGREHGAVAWTNPPAQTTAADGVFSFAFTSPTPHAILLSIRAPERTRHLQLFEHLDPGVLDLGDVRMRLACTVRGLVADTHDAPQAGVQVLLVPQDELAREGSRSMGEASAATAADGTFSLRLSAGSWRVEMRERRLLSTDEVSIAAEQRDLFLALTTQPLEEIDAITGVVVDDGGGPVRGASVFGDAAMTETSRDGSFRLERPQGSPRDPVRLAVSSERGTHESLTTETRTAWGTTDVRIVLPRKLSAEIVVVDAASGAPIEEYEVRCFSTASRDGSWTSSFFAPRSRGKHPAGKARIDGVARGGNELLVVPVERGWDETKLLAFDSSELERGPLRVALPRTVAAVVRVTARADAAPIAGTRVELLRQWTESPIDLATCAMAASSRSGSTTGPNRALRADAGDTRADGSVELHGPLGVPLAVRVLGPGHAPRVVPGVTLAEGGEIAVTVDAGATLAGTVGPAALLERMRSRFPPGLVFTRRAEEPKRFPLGVGARCALDERGAFSCSGIPPGTWDVSLEFGFEQSSKSALRSHSTRDEKLQTISLREGERRKLDIDLAALVPGRVTGRVLVNGAVPANANVHLLGDKSDARGSDVNVWSDPVAVDTEGAFAIDAFPATYRLHVTFGDPAAQLPARESVTVTPGGTVEQAFTVESAVARIRILGSDGVPRVGVPVAAWTDDKRWGTASRATDADGWVAFDHVPAGRIALTVRPKHLADPDALQAFWNANATNPAAVEAQTKIAIGHVDARARETTEVEITLPAEAGY